MIDIGNGGFVVTNGSDVGINGGDDGDVGVK